MRHGEKIDPVVMASALVLGIGHAKRQQARKVVVMEPTPEQLAARERDEWNKRVDARKAAKKG